MFIAEPINPPHVNAFACSLTKSITGKRNTSVPCLMRLPVLVTDHLLSSAMMQLLAPDDDSAMRQSLGLPLGQTK